MPSATAAITDHDRRMLALARTPQLGATRLRRLLERVPDPAEIFRLSLTELEALELPATAAQAIALGGALKSADAELARLAATPDVALITYGSPHYPALLAAIYDPPLALYVRGAAQALDRPALAIVGTRHPTPYGLGMAERLAQDLATAGLVVVSGLARGVDAAAHRGAVAARAPTIAVFGTGVNIIYPRENRRLAEQILECGGALLSEFPLSCPPTPHNFPLRNRIISGLAHGVLVVEAGEYSGTRITSRCALEQSREVFAVPGNVTNKMAWTPNTLIKQGAKLVATWEDVIEELPSELRQRLRPQPDRAPQTASLFDPPPEMPNEQRQLLEALHVEEARQLDELIEQFEGRLSSPEIFTALFELELAGKIRQMPGKNYVRVF